MLCANRRENTDGNSHYPTQMKSFLPYILLFCHLGKEPLLWSTVISVGEDYSISENGA